MTAAISFVFSPLLVQFLQSIIVILTFQIENFQTTFATEGKLVTYVQWTKHQLRSSNFYTHSNFVHP